MAASRVPTAALSLKQFMLRQQSLQLYRDILRCLKEVENKDSRKELADWARTEFKKNKNEKDEMAIKMMHSRGRLSLREMQRTISLAK
ncbi:LYR motif-containing protein 2-like [Saccoglossus kowalevskii]|uniref:LYR motif-containing protein 2 n=1 Tax=Saccoglossus kowalevskii TaxID=10224 RepID=A0ABM0M2D0_SACKO|nr:PREDICTED: LYR motif-containing protein 2-like [Saccoglossus kowalevskii]